MPTLSTGEHSLELRWSDGTCAKLPYIWLRDTDPSGFHPQTGERIFELTSVAIDITPDHVELRDDRLLLTWPGSDTPGEFDLNWLKTHRPGQRRSDPADVPAFIWRADLGGSGVPRHLAETVLASGEGLANWLRDTKKYGLSIVTGLANSTNAGTDIARRIAHLRETNFGLTFEVMSKPDPNNLAYTSVALPLHTDLTNQELPPGFQFLHCLANEAEGGGSTFCDGVAVAEDLRANDREAFDILTTVSVPFRFQDKDTDIRSRKTLIVLDGDGRVDEICFNAHIADIVDLDPDLMVPFYRAYQKFMGMLRDPAYVISLRLSGGEMVVFDNRRVLHGRESFDPTTGFRHLHGCYVDRGDWDSRLRVLARAADV